MASTYLNFEKAQRKGMDLIRTDENKTLGLLIVCGINFGLRIGDLLTLTFADLKGETFTVKEQKTNKIREVVVLDNVRVALEYFRDDPSYLKDGPAFLSQKGTIYSIQHSNRLIKQTFKGRNISSHSLRKTFGRRFWEVNHKTDAALLHLCQSFNHSTPAITRSYLCITSDETKAMTLNMNL